MSTAAVGLAEIERQLASSVRARPARTRATAQNLICCAEDAADAAALAPELARLLPRHPGRVLLLAPAAAGAAGWRARLLHLGAASPDSGACGEVLQLEAAGLALLAAAQVLPPLLLGEAPVFLWWRGEDPVANPRYEALAAMADRVFFDSQRLAFAPAAFLRLAELERGATPAASSAAAPSAASPAASRRRVCDLTWSRLARWRRLISQAFESRAAARHLARVSELTLAASGEQPALNGGSLLLAGWLASRLGWREPRPAPSASAATAGLAAAPAGAEFSDARGETVRVVFRAGAGGATDHILAAAGLASRDGFAAAVAREGEHMSLDLRLQGQSLGRSTAPCPMPTCFDALRLELDVHGPDPVFEQSLAAAAALARALGVQ